MRAAGVLMHITSLSSPFGIGTMGQAARDFVDFLKAAGQKYWQILPLSPTGYGDSPYQSFSAFAGNPYLLDLDMLAEDGLLKKEEYEGKSWGYDDERVDYGIMYKKRLPLLRKAAVRLIRTNSIEYDRFLNDKKQFWLEDYALYMALKTAHGGLPWYTWERELKMRDPDALRAAKLYHKDDIDFWKAVQFLFMKQWQQLKEYANSNGIDIIGDIPIYVACDSVDVWREPEQFQLDKDLCPVEVAGVPPDGFSDDGQLWGNPLFDWDHMKHDGYTWWIRRIEHVSRIYDVIRIDHFRGFAAYFAVPYGDDSAKNGRWRKGPGIDFIKAIESAQGKKRIIAEDLGYVDDEVKALLKESGYPGMKVLEFAFDSREPGDYYPHNYTENSTAYTGTHDNEPVMGWFESASAEDCEEAVSYLKLNKKEGYNWGMMRGVWSCVSDTAIVQAQDLLGLGHEARMNTPATTNGNWTWRAKKGAFSPELAKKIKEYMILCNR